MTGKTADPMVAPTAEPIALVADFAPALASSFRPL